MLIEYYMGRIAKVGGSPRATASTLPGLSACMYAGDMYVYMYVQDLQLMADLLLSSLVQL